MSAILKRAAKYKRVTSVLCEGEAHLKDSFTPPPVVLKPPASRKEKKADDITDFPATKLIPLPESIPYQEGRYRPASIPLIAGFFPYNCYLQQGKVYSWCSCGISQSGPWCDGLCNSVVTRNRPVVFNVSQSGYYKMCNCKFSANAPFCNGTHRKMIRYHHQSHRGFYEIWGEVAFVIGCFYMGWNYYT